jgi:hypothetical protein
MKADIQGLLDKYWDWLKDKTVLRDIGEWTEITTPYLDRHNDYVQIYARKEGTGFTLTDDGYTITDLEQSGCVLDSPKRQQLLKMTLNGFGVQFHDQAIQVHASADNFGLRKHNLIQAMLAVNDLFYLSAPSVASLFYEDVVAWLDISDIRYTPKAGFKGKTGYDHLFDFVVPKSRRAPERIIRAINRPTRDNALLMVQAWIDTKEVRLPDSKAYAFLNDAEQTVSSSVSDALTSCEVIPVFWSQRDSVRDELAA